MKLDKTKKNPFTALASLFFYLFRKELTSVKHTVNLENNAKSVSTKRVI